tara:strand:- start:533 stop:745 length:213 start_codon:yes stop_codon:yes gene_type:complete
MIDTDKYKKALETPCEYNVSYHSCMQIEELQICGYELLAEVKKLRDGINYIAYLPSLKPSIAKMMKELIE